MLCVRRVGADDVRHFFKLKAAKRVQGKSRGTSTIYTLNLPLAEVVVSHGAMMVAGALLPVAPGVRAGLTMTAIAVAVVPPIAYSWWFWRARRVA